MPLRIDVRRCADWPTYTLYGELDMLTAPQLTSRVESAIGRGAAGVVLDARHLQFCDSSGLAALVRLAQQLDAGGVTILAPRPIVGRLLEVSGMVDMFVVIDAGPAGGQSEHATVSPA